MNDGWCWLLSGEQGAWMVGGGKWEGGVLMQVPDVLEFIACTASLFCFASQGFEVCFLGTELELWAL